MRDNGISPGYGKQAISYKTMTKSPYASTLDAVQQAATDFLRPEGFKKQGRTYNRTVGDGLIHVINFQMGPYPIGEYVIPFFRENLYGKFVVNLGIFLPCVSQIEGPKRTSSKIIQEYYCQIRERLGVLAAGRDVWWSLDDPPVKIGKQVTNHLNELGLPFLSQYTNYSSVLSQYQAHGKLHGSNEGRSALTVAMIYSCLGDMESAKEHFDLAHAEGIKSGISGFVKHVENIRNLCIQ